jgi:hypothetical protein
MRVALIVMSMLMAGSSQASETCMSKAEAHQHFATSYLYWHGLSRCWDATPPHSIQKAQRRNRPLGRPGSMAQMFPHPEPMQSVGARASSARLPGGNDAPAATDRSADEVRPAPISVDDEKIEPTVATAPANRSEDVGQVRAPSLIDRKTEPVATTRVALWNAFFALGMVAIAVLAVIEFLFRRTYATRILAFSARRRSQPRPDRVRRPLDIEAAGQTSTAALVPDVMYGSEGNRPTRETVAVLDVFS